MYLLKSFDSFSFHSLSFLLKEISKANKSGLVLGWTLAKRTFAPAITNLANVIFLDSLSLQCKNIIFCYLLLNMVLAIDLISL